MHQNLDDLLKKETGSGIGIVIYGIVVLLVLTLVSVNILNAKIIQDGYDRLRDSLDAAVAGSVLHIAIDDEQNDEISGAASSYTYQYDPWLQLALGFLMQSDGNGTALNGQETVANDFIKFDRKKVVTHTMRVLQDGMLANTESIRNTDKYQILMIFLEPTYDNNLDKSIDIIVYDSSMFTGGIDNIQPHPTNFKGKYYNASGSDTNIMTEINYAINDAVNNTFVSPGSKTYSINLNGENSNLIEKIKTRPYYFVIVKDFALPTLFGNTAEDSVFVDLTNADGRVGPMFALQGANTKRVIKEEQDEKGVIY